MILRALIVLFVALLLFGLVNLAINAADASTGTRAAYQAAVDAHWQRHVPIVWHFCSPTEAVGWCWSVNDPTEPDARAEQPGDDVWINLRAWNDRSAPYRCALMTHEAGHLLGHGHSTYYWSIMYAPDGSDRGQIVTANAPYCAGFTLP